MPLKTDILNQLDILITEGARIESSFIMGERGTYSSGIPESELRAFVIAALAAITRISGRESEYYTNIPKLKDNQQISLPGFNPTLIPAIQGSLVALKSAVNTGWLDSLESQLRANVHDDFLQQAQDLLSAGYHVAAMVLIGGVLEDHLRKLCTNLSLTWSGNGSLSKYNDLLRDNAYAQPVWRRIQAISDVRNEAAHGNGTAVKRSDVEDALMYIGRLLADYPS